MNFRMLASAGVVALSAAVTVAAQHEGPQTTPAPQPPAAMGAQCVQAQRVVVVTLDAASERLETARQTNSPAAMRAAIDDLQAVLRDVRTRLAGCTPLGTAAEPHAGHTVPATGEKR